MTQCERLVIPCERLVILCDGMTSLSHCSTHCNTLRGDLDINNVLSKGQRGVLRGDLKVTSVWHQPLRWCHIAKRHFGLNSLQHTTRRPRRQQRFVQSGVLRCDCDINAMSHHNRCVDVASTSSFVLWCLHVLLYWPRILSRDPSIGVRSHDYIWRVATVSQYMTHCHNIWHIVVATATAQQYMTINDTLSCDCTTVCWVVRSRICDRTTVRPPIKNRWCDRESVVRSRIGGAIDRSCDMTHKYMTHCRAIARQYVGSCDIWYMTHCRAIARQQYVIYNTYIAIYNIWHIVVRLHDSNL